MPIDRYGSGNPYGENREDYSRASSLTSSQQQDIATYHHLGYNADEIAAHLRVDPRAVQDHLRQQGVAMDQPEASSSRGQTRRDETPFFDPGSPYVDPGAPSPYRQSEPPTPRFNADAWSAYGDPGAPRFQSSEPPTPRDTRPPRTPLFLDSPEPSTPRPSSLRQPSLPPTLGDSYSSTLTRRGGRSSTLPSQPPSSSSGRSRMPPPPLPSISQPQPRYQPYPPGSSQFGGSSLSGAIRTPDLNAMARPTARLSDSLPPGFTTEGLPPGWSANRDEKLLRSPDGEEHEYAPGKARPRTEATNAALSQLMSAAAERSITDSRLNAALGTTRGFFTKVNNGLPEHLQRNKMSREEISRRGGTIGGTLTQAKLTTQQRSARGRELGLLSARKWDPELRRNWGSIGGMMSRKRTQGQDEASGSGQAGPSRSGRSGVARPVQVDEETESSILERFNMGMDPGQIAHELNLDRRVVEDVLKPYLG